MNSFFNTPERVAKLLYISGLWLETPWCANSEVRGERGGVSCHNLPRAIYVECGALADSFPKVVGNPNLTRHSKVSVIKSFVDARPEFTALEINAPLKSLLLPGDMIGIRIYQCVDHLGLYLGAGKFIHVLMHKHTSIDRADITPWQERVLAAWRIAT